MKEGNVIADGAFLKGMPLGLKKGFFTALLEKGPWPQQGRMAPPAQHIWEGGTQKGLMMGDLRRARGVFRAQHRGESRRLVADHQKACIREKKRKTDGGRKARGQTGLKKGLEKKFFFGKKRKKAAQTGVWACQSGGSKVVGFSAGG